MTLSSYSHNGAAHPQPDLRQQLISLLSDLFQVEIEPDTEDVSRQSLATWDSFNHLRLVLELEQVFGISLNDEEVLELSSLHRIQELLQKRGVDH